MSLLTPRRIALGSAVVLAGVLGIGGVAMAQASTDDRGAVTPTPASTLSPSHSPTHSDDPATHDVGDDHGVDDPATHDVGDDRGGDDHADDNSGDDHGGDDNSGPGNSHDDSDDDSDDDSGHGGHGSDD